MDGEVTILIYDDKTIKKYDRKIIWNEKKGRGGGGKIKKTLLIH